MQDQAREIGKDHASRGIVFPWLVAALVCTSLFVLFEKLYLVRELLLFVTCAAVLAFFVANCVLLGLMVQSAARTIFRHAQKAKLRNASQEQVTAGSSGLVDHVVIKGPFVV